MTTQREKGKSEAGICKPLHLNHSAVLPALPMNNSKLRVADHSRYCYEWFAASCVWLITAAVVTHGLQQVVCDWSQLLLLRMVCSKLWVTDQSCCCYAWFAVIGEAAQHQRHSVGSVQETGGDGQSESSERESATTYSVWPAACGRQPVRVKSLKRPYNNNNNRLFMAPHLVRSQSTYEDTRIHSFNFTHTDAHTHTPQRTHTRTRAHTHTLQIHTLLVMDW